MRPLLIAIGIVLVQGCSSIEEPGAYYRSRQDLVADNAIARGWIPTWLPASAREINEAHNIDTNEVWLQFKLDAGDIPKINECRKDNTTTFSKARGPHSKHRSWWVKSEAPDWEGYACRWEQDGKAREAKMLVSTTKGLVLYWEKGH